MATSETEGAWIDPALLNPTERMAATQHQAFELQKAGLGSLAWLGTTWIEQMGALGSEVMDFLARRAREDARVQHEILHCRSLPQLQAIQARFLETAIER